MDLEIGLLISIIVGLVNLFLGILILLKNKDTANKFYALMSFSITVWAFSVGLGRTVTEVSPLLFWARIAYVAAAASAFFFLYFSLVFPFKKTGLKISRLSLLKYIIPFVIFASLVCWLLFDFTAFVSKVNMLDHLPFISNISFDFGTGYTVYSFYIGCFFIFGLINLLLKRRRAKGVTRTQISYVLWGSSITIVLSIASNLLPWAGMLKYNWLGPTFTIVMIVSIAYAIARYHLMNIKLIATELLVSSVSIILLFDLLLSKGTTIILLKIGTFIAFVYLGWSLIRSVLQEIKRRQQLENLSNQLKTANVKLKKLDKAKSEFVSIASHQLRTPLTAIKGYISMILEGTYGKVAKKSRRPMENVFEANERLIKLVNDLLSISRLESGKMEMKREKVALPEMITSVVNELDIKVEEKKLYIKWKEPANALPEIEVDRGKVRQIILNIIDNAIHYTEKGGITITLKKKGLVLRVAITDTGAGMTQDELEHVFESFSRGKAGTRLWTGGAGLGLYIAKKFTEMHRGRIWIESEGKDKGSTFFIELPLK